MEVRHTQATGPYPSHVLVLACKSLLLRYNDRGWQGFGEVSCLCLCCNYSKTTSSGLGRDQLHVLPLLEWSLPPLSELFHLRG